MLSRRQTLALGTGALAAASLGGAARAAPASQGPIIVNALGGPFNPNIELGEKPVWRPGGQPLNIDDRAIRDAHASGVTAINITLGYVFGDKDPHPFTLETLDQWDKVMAGSPQDLVLIRKAGDIA